MIGPAALPPTERIHLLRVARGGAPARKTVRGGEDVAAVHSWTTPRPQQTPTTLEDLLFPSVWGPSGGAGAAHTRAWSPRDCSACTRRHRLAAPGPQGAGSNPRSPRPTRQPFFGRPTVDDSSVSGRRPFSSVPARALVRRACLPTGTAAACKGAWGSLPVRRRPQGALSRPPPRGSACTRVAQPPYLSRQSPCR